MKVVTAKVIDGRIEVPTEIADGSQVAILAPDSCEPAELSPEEERELSEALAEIHAGRYIAGWALLDELTVASRAVAGPWRQLAGAVANPCLETARH